MVYLFYRNNNINRIPQTTIASILTCLTSLDCRECPELWAPPQEICAQGGAATVKFIRALSEDPDTQYNTDMNLFFIGEGEAGKTSVILALKSDSDQAYHIRVDQRTVGIDLSVWEPKNTDMKYLIYDLAGQAVYSTSHRFFLLRRAVYIFVWRPKTDPMNVNENLDVLEVRIRYWLDSLQNQVPGSFVMLVVTHVDLVEDHSLIEQTIRVKNCIKQWQESKKLSSKADFFRPLKIFGDGESLPVSCISAGGGIKQLRDAIINFTKSMPWFREALPASWIKLKMHISKMSSLHHIDYDQFRKLALQECQVGSLLDSATRFLHDIGAIRYFGFSNTASKILKGVVYTSPEWMMNIMKGLLRHERQALIDFFLQSKDKKMLRRVNRLNTCGVLHKTLVPYIWPSREESSKYWNFVRSRGKREVELWESEIITSDDEAERALELLDAFNLIVRTNGDEFLVPGILPPSICLPIPSSECFPFWIQWKLPVGTIPVGTIGIFVVRIVKELKYANSKLKDVELNAGLAVFQDKSGHLLQLIVYPAIVGSPFVGWQGDLQDSEVVLLRSSSLTILNRITTRIEIEQLFPGVELKIEQASLTWEEIDKKFANPIAETEGIPKWSQSNCLEVLTSGARIWIEAAKDQAKKIVLQNNQLKKMNTIECLSCETAIADLDLQKCLDSWKKNLGGSKRNDYGDVVPCPDCNHQNKVFDLLTYFKIPEMLKCPCCLEHSDSDYGLFNVSECRLRNSDTEEAGFSDKSSTGYVYCLKCIQNGRMGQLSILDLAPPEVYVSGWKALEIGSYHLDAMKTFLKEIEYETNVVIWNIALNLNAIEGSKFVLAFLSDAYICSQACRDEFFSSYHSCKHIVPILMPKSNLQDDEGNSFGWSGPGSDDQEYWKHATLICPEKSFDWSFLAEFRPVQLRKVWNPKWHPPIGEMWSWQQSSDVVSIIQGHLQQQGKMDIFTDFPMLGIRISYLDKFIENYGGREIFLNKTTTQVRDDIILPATKDLRVSFCELMKMQQHSQDIGTAEWFYSHAWSYRFLDTVDAAKRFFKLSKHENSDSDPFIWFDIFSVSQHKAETRPFEWWNTAFLNAVGSMGKVLMMMQPFKVGETPSWTTLTRVWCVFEMYACESTKGEFHVTMTDEMSKRFHAAIKDNATLDALLGNIECADDMDQSVLKSLVALKCENSQSFKPDDRKRVFEVIETSIGFPLLNSMVIHVMEQWLERELHSQIAEGNLDHEKTLQILKHVRERCLQRRLDMKGIGEQHPDILRSKLALAELLKEQRK